MTLTEARIQAQTLAAGALTHCAKNVKDDEAGLYQEVDRRRIANYLHTMAAAHQRRADFHKARKAGDS